MFRYFDDGEMLLNDAGRIMQAVWDELPSLFPRLELDAFVMMPNHVHGIIVIVGRDESRIRPGVCREPNLGDQKDRSYGTTVGSMGQIIKVFKSMVTHEYVMGIRQQKWTSFQRQLWQRNYYEYVIRDEDDMNRIRQYILDNPACWSEYGNNPEWMK
jgi:REP element-mobilizing transposase RayT